MTSATRVTPPHTRRLPASIDNKQPETKNGNATDNPFAAGLSTTSLSSSQDVNTSIIERMTSHKRQLENLLESPQKNYEEIFNCIKSALTEINNLSISNLENPDILKPVFQIIDWMVMEAYTIKLTDLDSKLVFDTINCIYCKILTSAELSRQRYSDYKAIENHCTVYGKYFKDNSSVSIAHEITPEFLLRNSNITRQQEYIEDGTLYCSKQFDSLTNKLGTKDLHDNDITRNYDRHLILIDCALKALKTGDIDSLHPSLDQFFLGQDNLNPTKLKNLLDCICKILKLEIPEKSNNITDYHECYHKIVDKICQELNKPENAPLLRRLNNGTPITKKDYTLSPHYYLDHITLKKQFVKKKLIEDVGHAMAYSEKTQKTEFVDLELTTLNVRINKIIRINKLIADYNMTYDDFISDNDLHPKIIQLYKRLIDSYNDTINLIFGESHSTDLNCDELSEQPIALDILNKQAEMSEKISQLKLIQQINESKKDIDCKSKFSYNIAEVTKKSSDMLEHMNKQLGATSNPIQYLHLMSHLINPYSDPDHSLQLQQALNQLKIRIIELQTQELNNLLGGSNQNIPRQKLQENFITLLRDLNMNISQISPKMLNKEGEQKIAGLMGLVSHQNNHGLIHNRFDSNPLNPSQESNNIIGLLDELKEKLNNFTPPVGNLDSHNIKVTYTARTGTSVDKLLPQITYIEGYNSFKVSDKNNYQIFERDQGFSHSIYMLHRLSVLLYKNDLTIRNPEQRLQILKCEISNMLEIMRIYKSDIKDNKTAPNLENSINFYKYMLYVGYGIKNPLKKQQFRREFLCLLLNEYKVTKHEVVAANQQTLNNDDAEILALLEDKQNLPLLNKVAIIKSKTPNNATEESVEQLRYVSNNRTKSSYTVTSKQLQEDVLVSNIQKTATGNNSTTESKPTITTQSIPVATSSSRQSMNQRSDSNITQTKQPSNIKPEDYHSFKEEDEL